MSVEDDEMPRYNRSVDAKVIDELEKEIVKVAYSDSAPPKTTGKNRIDTAKILRLSKKIRETYDYSDPALRGAH